MIYVDEKKRGYFKGFKCEQTGRSDKTSYSFEIVEFEFLEGVNKGETFWQPENCIAPLTIEVD